MINPRHGMTDHPRALEIEKIEDLKTVRLNLGCGTHLLKNWTNIDKFIDDPQIKKWAMHELKTENESCDILYSCHSLEHMPLFNAMATLVEWNRVSKFNADLIIAVPDTETICEKFPENPEWYTKCLYGLQTGPGHIHFYGYTRNTLEKVLMKCGFKVHRMDRYMFGECPSLWCESKKTHKLEKKY